MGEHYYELERRPAFIGGQLLAKGQRVISDTPLAGDNFGPRNADGSVRERTADETKQRAAPMGFTPAAVAGLNLPAGLTLESLIASLVAAGVQPAAPAGPEPKVVVTGPTLDPRTGLPEQSDGAVATQLPSLVQELLDEGILSPEAAARLQGGGPAKVEGQPAPEVEPDGNHDNAEDTFKNVTKAVLIDRLVAAGNGPAAGKTKDDYKHDELVAVTKGEKTFAQLDAEKAKP